jgi:AraC-like DNA-binding protein
MPRRTDSLTHLDRQRLERATAHYLRDCYNRGTAARVSELAAHVGISAADLSRFASAVLGMSLRDFLRARQVARAEELLRTTPLAIEDIAVRCGFGTSSTFYRWFIAAHGMAPGAYRRIMK